jgi:hypothetical protein
MDRERNGRQSLEDSTVTDTTQKPAEKKLKQITTYILVPSIIKRILLSKLFARRSDANNPLHFIFKGHVKINISKF